MSKKRLETNRKLGKYVIPFTLLFILCSILFWLVYPFPSNEKVNYFTNEHAILIDKAIAEKEALIDGETIYIPFEFVREYLDEHLLYDVQSSSVIVTTKDKVVQMPTDHLTYYVNQQEHTLSFPALRKNNNRIYLDKRWLENVYPIQIDYAEETGAVHILRDGENILKGTATSKFKKDLFRVRIGPNLTTPYVAELEPNEQVIIEEEENQFYKIRKENGIAGYVEKKIIKLDGTEKVETNYETTKQTFDLPKLDWPLHLTWDAIYHVDATPSSFIAYDGVQVISPTWFHLDDEKGNIRSYAKTEYMEEARKLNFEVWALFSNDFNAERTHHVLQTYESRQKVISQLLEYAKIYDLDGYNIDFENVMLEDGDLLTQFIREFTPLAHEAGLVVSMDITFISSNERYSMFYDREELAEVVDYLIVMAYDEHWASSPIAGSVASLPWVEENLQKLLEVVPNDRLLLGVPLYTRLWSETVEEDGSISVKSESMSMNEVEAWIKEHKVSPLYDENAGQLYVEWKDQEKSVTYKIWIENELSLKKRAELVHKYKLAGLASWSDYFASETIWKDLNNSLRLKKVVKNTQNNS